MNIIKLLSRILIIAVICTGLISARPLAPAAVTILVTTSEDEFVNNEACSLREAIWAAHLNTSWYGCDYSDDGSGEAEIIDMQDHDLTFDEVCSGTDYLSCGDLDIIDSVTIQGAGMEETILDANFIDRVFDIQGMIEVTLADLTLMNGRAPSGQVGDDGNKGMDGSVGEDGGDGDPGADGGGILVVSASLNLTRILMANNAAGDGGLGGMGGEGGDYDGRGMTGGPGGNGGEGGDGGALYAYLADVII